MILYIILPVAAVALGVLLCRNRLGKAFYCMLMGVGLFVISAIRFGVGTDYFLYANWYNEFYYMPFERAFSERYEKGFIFLFKLLSDTGVGFGSMFVVIALIICIGVFVYIYKYSELPWVSAALFILFGLFFNSMNFMRQMIAAVIIMYAIRHALGNRFGRFFALVIFAMTFHYSAVILLPFFFLMKIKITRVSLPILSLAAFITYIFSSEIITFVTKYIYTGYDLETNVEISSGLSPVYTIFFGVFFIVALLMRNILSKRDKNNTKYITLLFFALYFSFIGTAHGIISRFALYFLLPCTLTLAPHIYLGIKDLIRLMFRENKKTKVFAGILTGFISVSILGGFYSYLLLYPKAVDGGKQSGYNGVVPYHTIFNEEERGDIVI